MCGDSIANEIGKRRGEKPKAGTIYPALKYLNENKLIKGERSGKMVVYTLTENGEKALKKAKKHFMRSFTDIFTE